MKFKKPRNLLLFAILIIFSMQLIGLGFLFVSPVQAQCLPDINPNSIECQMEKSANKSAENSIEPGGVTFIPQVDIPGSDFVKGDKVPIDGSMIAKYIQAWYKFAVAAVGILAVVMIMAGGLIWLTAAGRANQISTAKDWITGAVVGLILALMSYTLLDILNPSLVTFQSLEVTDIEDLGQMCCHEINGPGYATGSGCISQGPVDTSTKTSALVDLGEPCDGGCVKFGDEKFHCLSLLKACKWIDEDEKCDEGFIFFDADACPSVPPQSWYRQLESIMYWHAAPLGNENDGKKCCCSF